MQLEVGKTYNTQEFSAALGVSRHTFVRNKEKYLERIGEAYRYEVSVQGRATCYTILEQIGEYSPPDKKYEKQRERNNQTTREFINKTIERDNLQTAANVNRIAWMNVETDPSPVALLGLQPSTTEKYIQVNMKDMYGTEPNVGGTDGYIEEKVWCRPDKEHNTYSKMSQEEIDEFRQLFHAAEVEREEFVMKVCAAYDAHQISEEELHEYTTAYNAYVESKRRFKNKYGYYPVMASAYTRYDAT